MKFKQLILVMTSIVFSSVNAVAHEGEDYFGHHGMMGSWYGGMWGASLNSILITIVLILLIFLLIVIIQKQLSKK